MQTIRSWKAKRSGTGMSITGQNAFGAPARIHAVEIQSGDIGAIAVTADGTKYSLLPQNTLRSPAAEAGA